jgi:hypothetical protein
LPTIPIPLNFEQLDHGYGYVLYTTTLTAGGKNLAAPNIHDYGYVFVNNVYQVKYLTEYKKRKEQEERGEPKLCVPRRHTQADQIRVMILIRAEGWF